MIPHFQSQRKLPYLPCNPPPFSCRPPPHLQSEPARLRENENKQREEGESGYENLSCDMTKKIKTAKEESNMSSHRRDSAPCPLAFHMSQTIFKNHQTRSHIHRRVYNAPQRCTATIIEFLCSGICADDMRSPHFIPHVKSRYSRCSPLIDSSFLHFISRLHAQGFTPRLQSHFWFFWSEGGVMM